MWGSQSKNSISWNKTRATDFFDCGVSFVYNSCFTDNLIEMTKGAMKMGARSVRICPCNPTFANDTASDEYMIETQLYIANVIRDYQQLCDITGGKLCFSMKMPLCLWPEEFLNILIKRKQMTCTCQVQKRAGISFDPDGNLLMCNLLFDYPIGAYGKDFSDRDSLVAYLNSDKVLGYYDRINAYPSTKCIGCSKFNTCSGGCPLRWAVYEPESMIRGEN